MVAQQHGIAARVQGGQGGGGVADGCAVDDARALHAQVVAEDHPVKAKLAAQDVLQPAGAKASGAAVHLGVNNVRRHDAGEHLRQPGIGGSIVGQDGRKTAFIHRHGHVRIGRGKAVPRKMLAAVGHARLQQAVHQALRQAGDGGRVAAKAAVANDAAGAPVQIQHRGKAQIHPASAQFSRQHVAAGQRCLAGAFGAGLRPQLAQHAHGGQVGEPIGAKALHAPAFVIDANEQVGPQRLDLGAQGRELGTVVPVAAKQNHAANQRMGQALAVDVRQRSARNINDQRGMAGRRGSKSSGHKSIRKSQKTKPAMVRQRCTLARM